MEPATEAKPVPADPENPVKPDNPAADPAGKIEHKNRAIENWMKGHMEQVGQISLSFSHGRGSSVARASFLGPSLVQLYWREFYSWHGS